MAIDRKYVIQRQGKDHVLYPGLLDKAHEKGLVGTETELIQVPNDDNGNVAIVHAVVLMDVNDSICRYAGIGDASPQNVSRNIAPHIIRMAETRAKARALRDAINAAEAVDETEDEASEPAPQANVSQMRGRAREVRRGARPGTTVVRENASRESSPGEIQASMSEEHRELVEHVGRIYHQIHPDHQPDSAAVWEYAEKSDGNAEKMLKRLLNLREEHPAVGASER